jgi:hypothetical protein
MRKMRNLSFVVLFLLVIGTVFTMAVSAASQDQSPTLNGIGQCFGVPPDAKDENGTDGWDIYAPEGFVFAAAEVKAGPDCYGNGDLYQITGVGTDHVTAVRLCQDCPEISHLEGMWEETPPQVCEETVYQEGTWSDWYPHPEDEGWECHSRLNLWVDAIDLETVCEEAFEEVCREIPPEVCLETIPVYGEWSDWEVDPQDPTRECRWQEVTYVDAFNDEIICDVEIVSECQDIPQELSIVTSSWCIDETTMAYETVVSAPPGTKTYGEMTVLWFYPNGIPFLTGETYLGPVPLVGGDNVFTSSMTQEELIAAIGENNLTGGNPANDFMYDHLDLYTYEVIVYLGDIEQILVSNRDHLWENCGREGGTCCECPTCGPPIQETMGESMGIAWYSDVPCTEETCLTWWSEHNPIVKIWTRIKNFVQHEGELIEVEEIVDANGEICYVDFFHDGNDIGDFILWGPDGIGDRVRNYFPASDPEPHKYSSCSIFPSWCDTRLEDGVQYALYLPGHTVSDWALFLLNNGFFLDEEMRGTAALEWADQLREEGQLILP